jgi:hypothetical protein
VPSVVHTITRVLIIWGVVLALFTIVEALNKRSGGSSGEEVIFVMAYPMTICITTAQIVVRDTSEHVKIW